MIHHLKKMHALYKSKDLPAQHHAAKTQSITPNDYMLAYTIEGHPDLHVTHHLFNNLSQSQVHEIQNKIEDHFSKNPLKDEHIEFTNREHWGPNQDIPVLSNADLANKLDPELKLHFNKLQPSKFPKYIPHVTEERTPHVKGRINGYYFVQARRDEEPQKVITEVKPATKPNQKSQIIHHEKPEMVAMKKSL